MKKSLEVLCGETASRDIEACKLERARRTSLLGEVGDERLELLGAAPQGMNAEAHRGGWIDCARDEHRPDVVAIDHARFESEDVEAESLVEEANEPRLRSERRAVSVRLLAQLDDPGASDDRAERLQISEVVVVERRQPD